MRTSEMLTAALAAIACSCGSGEPAGAPTSQSSQAINSSPALPDFVLYAERSIALGIGSHSLGGDMGVASSAPGSGPAAQLIVGDLSGLDVFHNLIAPSIELGHLAVVGDIQTNTLQDDGGVFLAQSSFPASAMPALPIAPAVAPGTTAVNVGPFQIMTLTPGNYGALTDNGILRLNPGNYTFASIKLGVHAQLIAQPGGATTVLVAGTLATDTGAQIFPILQPADRLSILVAAVDDASGSPTAATLGNGTLITALLQVPRGTLALGDNIQAKGAYLGFDITAGRNDLFVFQSGLPPAPPAPPGQLPVSVYTPPPASPIVGAVPPDQKIAFNLVLPLRNVAGLQAAIAAASDPKSPTYRQYVDAGTFAATYAPTTADTAQFTSWAQSNGLSAFTYPHNTVVTVSGTAAKIEQALSVNLLQARRPDGSVFYEPDRQPSINVAVSLLGLRGIDSYFQMKPVDTGSGFGNSYQANDLRTAYLGAAGTTCANLDGTNQFIGLVQGDGFNQADVNQYASLTGLPAPLPVQTQFAGDPGGLSPGCPTCDNSKGIAPPLTPSGEGSQIEVNLDIDIALAMAPRAQIILFEGSSSAAFLANIAANPQVRQISSSWGIPDDDVDEQLLMIIAAQGQSFFMASHDSGAYQPTGQVCTVAGATPDTTSSDKTPDAAASAYVTAVGGTVLTTAGPGGAYASETAWIGSGGGIITTRPLPAFQVGVNPLNAEVSTVNRNVPDVSAVGQNLFLVTSGCNGAIAGNVGDKLDAARCANQACDAAFKLLPCPVAQQTTGIQFAVNGTSASSPLWAGFMALVNQSAAASGIPPVGYANPALYQLARSGGNAFQDVTAGNNKNACNVQYTAQSGYDLATGLGSPTCNLLTQLKVRPSVDVKVTDTSTGPLMCMSGRGFTQGGTVTLQYVNVPEDGTSAPPRTVTATQAVTAAGTFYKLDDETGFVTGALATPPSACTPAVIGNGVVTVNAIDNTTGIAATTTMPASFWCQITDGAVFNGGCAPITVRYEQLGACTHFSNSSGTFSTGPHQAYVAFDFEGYDNEQPTSFVFDPNNCFVHQADGDRFVNTNDPINSIIFGVLGAGPTTFSANTNETFQIGETSAAVVRTSTEDGEVEASQTAYTLSYKHQPGDPPVILQKLNPGVTSFGFTDDCGSAF